MNELPAQGHEPAPPNEAAPMPSPSPVPEPPTAPTPTTPTTPSATAALNPDPAAAPRPTPRPPDAARCHRGIRATVLQVWQHLSRPELQRRWLGEADIELAVGGAFSLKSWNGDFARGRVLLADPPSTLSFTWRPHGTGAESRVTIRLQGDGPGTRVMVRHEQLASEPERRQARRLWREVLGALRTAIHEERDAHEWGATLPIAVRAPLGRTASDVWPLLSTTQGLEKWLAHVERFDAAPEGAFRFRPRAQEHHAVEEGTIDLLVPESRLVLSWEWEGASWGARTKVEFSLEPDPSGSALLLLHSGFDRIPPAAAAEARRYYAARWPRLTGDLRRLVAPVAVS